MENCVECGNSRFHFSPEDPSCISCMCEGRTPCCDDGFMNLLLLACPDIGEVMRSSLQLPTVQSSTPPEWDVTAVPNIHCNTIFRQFCNLLENDHSLYINSTVERIIETYEHFVCYVEQNVRELGDRCDFDLFLFTTVGQAYYKLQTQQSQARSVERFLLRREFDAVAEARNE